MKRVALVLLSVCWLAVAGCVPTTTNRTAAQQPAERAADLIAQAHARQGARISQDNGDRGGAALPVRFQQPGYVLQPAAAGTPEETTVPVGADISTKAGPVPLRDIIKRLAALKNMNVSWANDVDQGALVDVDIRAEDDFFAALDHLLRQLDYFYEVEGNTIVIKYKDVRKFHIAMPFIGSSYSHGVGGDVLGGSGQSGNMQGLIQLTTQSSEFDIWKNIQANLDKVLEIWTAPAPQTTNTAAASGAGGDQGAGAGQGGQQGQTATAQPSRPPAGKGYYTIDKPIGLITVTAPRSLLEKIATYIENLKSELYRQVEIEAKIVEVTLNDDNTTGIDWAGLLQDTANGFSFGLDFQKLNPGYPSSYGRFLTLGNKSFNLFLDAIREQGSTDVIANPRISVMNGQPAMINIGQNVTYIDSVTSTTNDGVVSYSVSTSSVMSGLGLAVIPTILNDNEVILSLTPVTSQLEEPIEYKTFGGANQVGLPKVKVREMTTLVRVKDGEMLVVGGLIDNSETTSAKKIPGLGDIPGVGKLFGKEGTAVQRKELIIFLKPRIIS